MASTVRQKELKTKWPVVEGTTAATTKQTGKKYLHPEGLNGIKSTMRDFESAGLGD